MRLLAVVARLPGSSLNNTQVINGDWNPSSSGPSPLQPDPPGREDIMSDEPREKSTFLRTQESPLPRDAVGSEDVLQEEPAR